MIKNSMKTVLIADDDADLLLLAKLQLQKAGYRVKLAYNGEGLPKLAAEQHADIIFLDQSMQGITGEEICRLLKSDQTTSSIPVIIFSANDNIECISRSCGAIDFIKKPFNLQYLQDKISRYA